MREHEVVVPSDFQIAGTLCLPEGASATAPVGAVLILAGSNADTRDGDLDLPRPTGTEYPSGPGTMRRIAHQLAHHGVASLRFDRRAFGASGGSQDAVDYDTDLTDAVACFGWLAARPEIDGTRVAVSGHSAGALVACQLCREVPEVAGAIFLGALASPIEDMIRWNVARITQHWDHFTADQQAWLAKENPVQLLRAQSVELLLAATERGDETFQMEGHGVTMTARTARLRQDLATDYAAEFRHVSCPALVLHGGDDLNVGIENAHIAYRSLRAGGCDRVDLVILPGLEHYFCPVSADPALRIWERVSLEAIRRPMATEALDAIAYWAAKTLA